MRTLGFPAALGLSENMQQGWEPGEVHKGNYSVANAEFYKHRVALSTLTGSFHLNEKALVLA